MATYFYGVNNGQNEYEAAFSPTTTGRDVELVVNASANIPSREELLLAVEKLENLVLRTNWPPV